MSWWGSREKPSPRMIVEILAMKKLFNTTKPTIVRREIDWDRDFAIITESLDLVTGKEPYWLVKIRMKDKGEKPSPVYTLKISYYGNFPHDEPEVRVPEINVRETPHRYTDTRLCLTDHSGSRTGWDPSSSTAATVGLWSVEWLRAWKVWKQTGRWPEKGGT